MAIRHVIKVLATKYASELKVKVDARVAEMKADDTSHHLIYKVLGITDQEGELIDVYQNKGRFLYKYAGSFLEEAVKLCFRNKYPDSASQRILNTEGQRPKTFEIDCVDQAIRIQQTLQTLYEGLGGEYHLGDAAWKFVKDRTEVDLLAILRELAQENTR